MDLGNVPADNWYYAALAPMLLAGAVLLFRRGHTAPAAAGLGLMMVGNGVQAVMAVMIYASTTATQATVMSWLGLMFAGAVWLSGYVWLIGYVPAGWNAWMRQAWFRFGASALIFAAFIWQGAAAFDQATFVGGPGYPIMFGEAPSALFQDPPSLATWTLSTAVIAASLAIAVSAAIRSTPGVNRRSAFAYLIGIGIIDLFVLYDAFSVVWPRLVVDAWAPALPWVAWTLYGAWLPAWVAYAILTTRLFNIDLRIKAAIDHGSLVAIFVAVFFGVSLFVQEWLTQSLGLLGGAMAAGALFLALGPLRRVTARIAASLMPNTVASPAYTTHRKVEIYREALRETLETGGSITTSERRLLDRLRDQLELDAPSVAILESEAQAGRGATSRDYAAE